MADNESNSYRSILKGTSFLGGVQLFLILISVIRGKIVAMLLGPEGMGISNLFNSAANSIQRIASLGLNLSIVREVADAQEDPDRLATLRKVVTTTVQFTALAGALFAILFSGMLSRMTFGSPDYRWQFMLLGAAIYLMISGNGKLSILQGLHEVKAISKSSLIGSLTGLLASIPLYYFYRAKGIVPAITIYSLATYCAYTWFLYRKVPRDAIRFVWRQHRPLIFKLLSLGIILIAGDLINSLCQYSLGIFIQHVNGLSELGYYQAANSMTMQYMGMVFTAMSLDYFPRLTRASSDNAAMREIVNRQSVLVSLVTTPLAILLIIFAPLGIRILLASEFESVTPLVRLFSLGILLKAFSFPMGYISFAKGNRRLYFCLEGLFANFLTLGLMMGGYWTGGLMGMGYAMIADNAICIGVYYLVNRWKYDYRFSRSVSGNYLLALLLTGTTYIGTLISDDWLSYPLLAVPLLTSLLYSYRTLRKLTR